MEQNKVPFRRIRHYSELSGMTVLASVFFAYQNRFLLDKVLVCLALDAVFLGLLFYVLESERTSLRLGSSASNDYGRISMCYGAVCLFMICFSFLPEFTVPAAVFALFFGLIANMSLSVFFTMFLCTLLCITADRTIYELAAYFLLTYAGLQAGRTMHEKKYRIWGLVILFSVSLCIPALFCYLAYSAFPQKLLIWNAGLGALSVLACRFAADRLYDKIDHEEHDAYERIISEEYPLVKDIKNYSRAEYVHALKVAMIAGKCAAEIGANEMEATAAGFYYRLGILEGEPFVENGVRLAQENCFPDAVVQILSEYNGEQRLPSSKESAIVHMVDACVKRMELLISQNLSSSWNQDMVIYQTLNEVSATGIYDVSGISMNQFLKIRERMVREEIGYDSNN